jgi:hypothetical protein
MAHFAELYPTLDPNIFTVKNVIVIDEELIKTGAFGNPNLFVQTSYNTFANEHKLNGKPLRGNFASKGNIYDRVNDVFYTQKPSNEHILNTTTWTWEIKE